MHIDTLSWNMYEHDEIPKTADWYWAVCIIALAATALAIFFGNTLFGIVILVATVTIILYSQKPPRMLELHLTPRGPVIDNRLYEYVTLESFWVEVNDHKSSKIIFKSKKTFMPYVTMPLSPDVHPDEVRELLLYHGLRETEHHEPLIQVVMEHLGF